MKFFQGINRFQISLSPVSLDKAIKADNEVRLIDLFVNALNIKDYCFKSDFDENGRPAYHPADLLKLFIYGYLNKIRSSRDLEKECKRNIEVMQASADVGLIMVAFNLRRLFNILGKEGLGAFLTQFIALLVHLITPKSPINAQKRFMNQILAFLNFRMQRLQFICF